MCDKWKGKKKLKLNLYEYYSGQLTCLVCSFFLEIIGNIELIYWRFMPFYIEKFALISKIFSFIEI